MLLQEGPLCRGKSQSLHPGEQARRPLLTAPYRSLKTEAPDVLVSTPAKLLALLENKAVDLTSLCFLAVDEADLLLSYGHKDDLTRLMDPAAGYLPKLGVQGCLMSATLSEDVEGVKGLVLRNPVRQSRLTCQPKLVKSDH